MTDLEIAHQISMKPIDEVASQLGLSEEVLTYYGKNKAKIDAKKVSKEKCGKLILVTAISPTPYGEGKTTVSIGLHDALCKLEKQSLLALREPSLGPIFGMKGGATGGGYAQIVPMEDINLHFTGDFHAITVANNLLCAAVDNHIYQGNQLQIDPETICVFRCLDVNDRALRTVSLFGKQERKDHFTITAASEMMIIFCLASDLEDLKNRIDRMVIGYTYDKQEVYAKQLNITGSLVALLKEAIKPNLVQTLEGNPVFVHGGPFANIAHGCNSLIATHLALQLSDYVITEAGFGSDLGAEKFFDIKCRIGELKPSVVVLVATLKALKYHAGILKEEIHKPNVEGIQIGSSNLKAHIRNLQSFHVPVVVCLNRYKEDTEEEVHIFKQICLEMGVLVEESRSYQEGGSGSLALAKTLLSVENKETLSYPYALTDSIEEKIEALAHQIYHANAVAYSDMAKEKIKQFSKFKYFPICISKTQYSLSDDPKKLGDPNNYTIYVTDLKLYAGAGFITVLLGDIMTMPGLPKKPNYEKIDCIEDEIIGLF